jgi:hypothetical protein
MLCSLSQVELHPEFLDHRLIVFPHRKKSANTARLKMKKAQSSKKRARSGGEGRGGDF